MVGQGFSVSIQELDEIRLSWGFELKGELSGISASAMQYAVFTVGQRIRFVGKVESVTTYPRVSEKPTWISFSSFIYDYNGLWLDIGISIPCEYGTFLSPENGSQILEWWQSESEKEKAKPEKIPLFLSIDEAAQALGNRYGVDPTKIKISLHN